MVRFIVICFLTTMLVLAPEWYLDSQDEPAHLWYARGVDGKPHLMKWGSPIEGTSATVSYYFIEELQQAVGEERQCNGETQTLKDGLKDSAISPYDFKREVLRAMATWSSVARIDFVPANTISN